MLIPTKSLLVSAVFFAGGTFTAGAQPQYQANYYNQVPMQAPVAPPASWSYDPYTSGLGPCPLRSLHDRPCSETMHPTYGQPSYWSR
jgi:hypothetical protein